MIGIAPKGYSFYTLGRRLAALSTEKSLYPLYF